MLTGDPATFSMLITSWLTKNHTEKFNSTKSDGTFRHSSVSYDRGEVQLHQLKHAYSRRSTDARYSYNGESMKGDSWTKYTHALGQSPHINFNTDDFFPSKIQNDTVSLGVLPDIADEILPARKQSDISSLFGSPESNSTLVRM